MLGERLRGFLQIEQARLRDPESQLFTKPNHHLFWHVCMSVIIVDAILKMIVHAAFPRLPVEFGRSRGLRRG